MKYMVALVLVAFIPFHSIAIGSSLVTYDVTATVDGVYDPLDLFGGSISAGDVLTGVLQYDLELPDLDPDSSLGYYSASPPGDNFIHGTDGSTGFFMTIDFFDGIIVNDDLGSDTAVFFATGDTTPSSLAHPAIDYVDLAIVLGDDDGTAFSDDSLPSSLDLADFEEAIIEFSSEDDVDFVYFVEATITSITQIPEPTTLPLVAISLLFVAISRNTRAGFKTRSSDS